MPRPKIRSANVNDENQDPDESILPDSEDKLKRKEAYLRDFAIQVADRVKEMESRKRAILVDFERISRSNLLKIKKEIRQMTVAQFEAKGGDLNTMELKEIGTLAIGDTSFAQNSPNNNATLTGNTKASTAGGRPTRKKEAPASLDYSMPKYTRPRTQRKRISKKQQLLPKFDIAKPPTTARHAMEGEVLVSLAGSPVVGVDASSSSDDTAQLFSVSGNPGDETVFLGGKLFAEQGMSPNSRYQLMNVIHEAINLKMEELNSARLDES